MSTPTISLLSGLVQGYVGEKDRVLKEELESRKATRDSMLQYLGHMVNSPDVPAEHKQWAMEQIPLLAQHDINKKFPKGLGDLSTLPPVTLKQPGAIQSQTLPGNVPPGLVQLPQPPGGASAPPGASGAPPAATGDVGRASNGTVNALGASDWKAIGAGGVTPPEPPPAGPIAARTPIQVPTPPQTFRVQAPDETTQISPGGAPHILTQGEKLQYASAAEQAEVNRLQQQYPDKSREDLLYMAQHGEFPKPTVHTLSPGQQLVEERSGKVIAENKEAKPGAKTGYEFDDKTGGVKDLSRGGAIMTPEEVASHPDAKSVFQQGVAERDRKEKEQEAKEVRLEDRQARSQARAFSYATTKAIEADAIKASRAAAPMVNVLDTSEAYMKSGQFTPRQDLALIVRAVRAMNPGTVRLPNTELTLEIKAGSYGDRFRRWFDTATTGTLPPDQRNDLMNVIREETTQTAKSAADNWRQAYGDSKPLPPHLKRFGGGGNKVQEPPPPSGGADELPPEARARLEEGHNTTFGNGQVWTLKDGKPQRVQQTQGAK